MDGLGVRIDLLLLFLSLFISFVSYPFWINFVYKFHMGEVSRVHEHKQGLPTMGGMVFVIAVALVTLLFNRSRTQTLLPIFIALVSGLLGLFEDFSKVYRKSGLPAFFDFQINKIFSRFTMKKILTFKPWMLFKEFSRIVGSSGGTGLETYHKFIIQGVIGGFMAYWAYFKLGWDYIWFPLVGNIHFGLFYPFLIFLFFIVVLNAVAFTDGLDGLAGGLALIAFLVFWGISRALGYNSLAGFCATFVGALIPFMYFNVYPARIMMGNVGSHVLGAVLAVLAVVTHREIAFLLIGLVFLVDGITSPVQQFSVKLTGKRLFRMAPIHHHFEVLGWPESKVTLRFWIFGMIFGLAGLFVALL
ncbi:phospho-N-acetylmuramoyl-pentapeptide-transferase [candidate division WWE3 bacterium]|uniref:Phospho-N-acetylmuramoyl-pentapeptide-transferase n=1 Tax=candidate division WWE3 bacterium TaxID=2053526 RepID=A0A3A4ZG34_UNCKA|nr:MAG: phospho-N-acetylmuramoyl-pentapeptide-transferase [candidate division WWE3 bacterium]